MKTASQILGWHKITDRSNGRDRFNVVCPKCSHLRKHKRKPCLSVAIDQQGVRWNCHHCQWHGGEFFDEDTGTDWDRGVRKARNIGGNSREVRNLYR